MSDGGKGFYTILKSVCLKVNVIEWLEFELAYLGTAGQHISDYITCTPKIMN